MDDLHRGLARRVRFYRTQWRHALSTAQRRYTEITRQHQALASALGVGHGGEYRDLVTRVLRMRADLAEERQRTKRLVAREDELLRELAAARRR